MTEHNSESLTEPGFPRPVNVEKLKPEGLEATISATDEELLVLAKQLKINRLDNLSFKYQLVPWKKGGVEVSGVVTATIEEICVVSLEPFISEISEDVKRFFERQRRTNTAPPLLDLEVIDDIDEDIPDIIEDEAIDLGAIAVETLALCLSPYPRKPGAVFEDYVESDPDKDDDTTRKNPFSVLKDLKKH